MLKYYQWLILDSVGVGIANFFFELCCVFSFFKFQNVRE
jgi:hypothetical protein